MQSAKTNLAIPAFHINKILLFGPAIILLILIGMFARNGYQTQSIPASRIVIAQRALEEQYGLRVNLIGVTAAGGFVDVRIKIVDGEKAKRLLADKQNFPALLVDQTLLSAPEDTRSQAIRFENDGTMFIMYVNSHNIVKPGTQVTILFGDLAVEAISAK